MQKEEKKPIHFETDVERYNKVKLIMEEKGFSTYPQFFEPLIDGASFLNPEILKELDSLFMEGNYIEKLRFIIKRFKEWSETFPYLNSQGREITLEDAGFLPCPYTKAVYWEGKFLGFQCRSIKPLAFKLNTLRFPMKNGTLSIQITTPEDCFECIELRKQVGTAMKGLPTLEQMELYKQRMMKRKEQEKSQPEREMTKKLEELGVKNVQSVKALLKIVTYDKRTQKWKGKSKASRMLEISRPTIDKILKALPNGIH